MSDVTQDDNATPADDNAKGAEPAAQRAAVAAARNAGLVGFIGLGAMGLPMAANLVRKGHAVLACDVDPGRLSLLSETCHHAEGLHTTPMPAEVGARCGLIVLMLPTSLHVDEVVMQLQDHLHPGALLIDMGSSIPRETRRIAADLAGRGIRYMDAPVSGSVLGAVAGTLSIMAGGADADVHTAQPVLEAVGKTIFRTGAVGSGHATKALNNFVYAAGLLAACEALRMGEAVGLDLSVLTDVINASSGRNFATETKMKQFVIPGTYAGGFKLGLMAKDLETAGALAEETGVNAAALETCRAAWRLALNELGPAADNTEIHRTVE